MFIGHEYCMHVLSYDKPSNFNESTLDKFILYAAYDKHILISGSLWLHLGVIDAIPRQTA